MRVRAAHARFEAHAVADGFARRFAERARHARRDRARREPPRLEHHDLAAAQPRFIEQRNRNNGALARAGRRFHDGIAMRCSAARNAGRISSMGRPDFTRPRIIPRGPLLTSAACAGARAERVRTSRITAVAAPAVAAGSSSASAASWSRSSRVFSRHRSAARDGPARRRRRAAQSEAPVEAGAPTDEAGQFVAHVLGDTEETWTAIFAQAGRRISRAPSRSVRQGINTGCGSATSAAGPFYCPRRSQGVHRPRVLPPARNRVRRAGRFRQGLRDRA